MMKYNKVFIEFYMELSYYSYKCLEISIQK